MSYNARLFNQPKLLAIVELTDSVSNECESVADALADYQAADELTGQDRADAREEAREAAWAALGDLLAEADKLRKLRDQLHAEG
jgi:hypothetical protein